VAATVKVAMPPTITPWFCGWMVMAGATAVAPPLDPLLEPLLAGLAPPPPLLQAPSSAAQSSIHAACARRRDGIAGRSRRVGSGSFFTLKSDSGGGRLPARPADGGNGGMGSQRILAACRAAPPLSPNGVTASRTGRRVCIRRPEPRP
jgi:hypothetical protein